MFLPLITFAQGKELWTLQKINSNHLSFLNSNVLCAQRDDAGFMWFGTQQGLCRYDGSKILEFSSFNSGLTFNNIHQIIKDDQGLLWLIKTKGYYTHIHPLDIAILDTKTLEIKTPESVYPGWENINYDLVHSIKKDHRGIIYFIDGKLNPFAVVKDGKLEFTSSPSSFYAQPQLQDEEVSKRLKTLAQIGIFLPYQSHNSKEYFEYLGKSGNDELINGSKHQTQDSDYKLFTEELDSGIKRELNLDLSKHKNALPGYRLFNPFKNEFWFWDNSPLIYSLTDKTHEKFTDHFPKEKIGRIFNIYFTPDLTWICTSKGAYSLRRKNSPFQNYLGQEDKNQSRVSCRSIRFKEDGNFVVAGVNAAYEVNPGTGKESALTSYNIHPILDIKKDTIIGTYANQFIQLIDKNITASNIQNESTGFWDGELLENGNYLLGGLSGLIIFDPIKKEGKKKRFEGAFSPLNDTEVFDILKTTQGQFIICTKEGVFLLNEQLKPLTRLHNSLSGNSFLPATEFFIAIEDHQEKIWFGTNGEGLLEWNPLTGQYKQYTIGNGLAGNIISNIIPDTLGNLWIGTYSGLSVLQLSSKSIKSFTKKDGLSDNEFNRGSQCLGPDGRVYLGGVNGVNAFFPEMVLNTPQALLPKLKIISINHYDSRSLSLLDKTQQFWENGKIERIPGEQYIELEIAVMDFHLSGETNFSYTIDGVLNQWLQTRDNKIRISGLPYGSHILRVKRGMSSNDFESQELSIPIFVKRPITATLGFIISMIVLGILLIFGFIKYRGYHLRQREKILQEKVNAQTRQLRKDKTLIQKQANRLMEMDKTKTEFFVNISHELKTPLSLITAPLESVSEKGRLDDESKHLVDMAKRNTDNLKQLIQRLTEFHKIDARTPGTDLTPLALHDFLLSKAADFKNAATRSNIKLRSRFDVESDLMIETDIPKLETIINNLLSNAIKYTQEGGEVEFLASQKKDEITFTIKDTGAGIPQEDLPFIFDRFFRSSDTQNKAGGLGIGLSLVRNFVDALQGKISVESRVGEGTRFTINLPLKPSMKTQSEAPLDKEDINGIRPKYMSPKLNGATILLVEDNPDLRTFISYLLSDKYFINTVPNGKKAMEFLATGIKPELIISDLMMPEMDGFEFLAWLKSDSHFSDIPCIVLTAKSDGREKLKDLRIGVDEYIPKPFTGREITAVVDRLALNQFEKENFNESLSDSEKEPIEKDWLKNLESFIVSNLSHSRFSVDFIAEGMEISRDKLYKKIKRLTGLTPNKLITNIRLDFARQQILDGKIKSVKEATSLVGLKKPEYFSKLFKERYGIPPSNLF